MAAGTPSFRIFTLGLLACRPMSGYDINRFFKSWGWLIGSPSFGIIYPALHALLEEGLVTVEVPVRLSEMPALQGSPASCGQTAASAYAGKPSRRSDRKMYRITEAGWRALQDWMGLPVPADADLKAFVMRLILVGSLSSDGLIAHLERRQAQVTACCAALERVIAEWDGEMDLGRRLAVDYGLITASAELAWLDRELVALRAGTCPFDRRTCAFAGHPSALRAGSEPSKREDGEAEGTTDGESSDGGGGGVIEG